MIKFHPDTSMLNAFVAGELPASLSIAVSAHIELCPQCREFVAACTESLASAAFYHCTDEVHLTDEAYSATGLNGSEPPARSEKALWSEDELSDLLDDITALSPVEMQPRQVNQVTMGNRSVVLPEAFNSFRNLNWKGLGGVSRARLPLQENEVRASLLKIEKNNTIPAHTHKGYELTLLLDGSFRDENGEYNKGDFILLNSTHHHSPETDEGCLCYTVSNAPLQFTQGLSKLLNPIGGLLY